MSISPIEQLAQALQQSVDQLDLSKQTFGNTNALIKAINEIEKVFGNVTAASPPQQRAYSAALKVFNNETLSEDEADFLASVIGNPIKEHKSTRIIDTPALPQILRHYRKQLEEDRLWRLTWYWLLISYFSIEHTHESNELTTKNIERLHTFLYDTYSHFTDDSIIPDWAKCIKEHSNLLTTNPCERYVTAYLNNDLDDIDQIKQQLHIPNISWFWQKLTLSLVEKLTQTKSDTTFKANIPRMIDYIEEHQGYRDQAIQLILERYYQCADKSPHNALRDYIIRSDVWKNPKLKESGIASKWYHVNENIRQMILNWVTREHLRVFFDIIANRYGARKDRFEFWSQYIDQIKYTKLVFGEVTERLRYTNSSIKKLFDEESGTHASLDSSNRELDAFIIQIKNHTFVEFSMNGNAAFIYETDDLPFSLKGTVMNDSIFGNGLKSGQWDKIIHNGDWQSKAKNRLMELGIYPDTPTRRR